ncbi:MAG: repeat, subgroup, partial [Pedosphaera sp.]|nr:repeat, subgroup [Pedosphaera sp.]
EWTAHARQIPTLALNPEGNILASGSRDSTIRLWDLRTGGLRDTLIGHTEDVMSVRFSPDGSLLASASYDHTVRLWAVTSGKCLRIFQGHTNRVFNVAFSPDGKQLASVGDATFRFWDVSNGSSLRMVSFGGKIVTAQGEVPENLSSVAFSPGGDLLAVSSTTGLTFWCPRKPEP